MRYLLAAALAASLMTVPAAAQPGEGVASTTPAPTSRCGDWPARLTDLPDGATATRRVIEEADQRVVAWVNSANQVTACRNAEIVELRTQLEALHAQNTAGAASIGEAAAAWRAETAEFNERNSSNRRSR